MAKCVLKQVLLYTLEDRALKDIIHLHVAVAVHAVLQST